MTVASKPQLTAADPRNSVWVSANAGAGKTTVLTSRVIRLLLAGADPSRILCVTFTKAAAANMQNRIFERLGDWVALDDAALSTAMLEMTGVAPGAADLKRARRLFARAVETPGGLKIQTIHGFCERLLHLFPFEAAVPARFQLLEDREQREVLDGAVRATLAAALADKHGPLGTALRHATDAAAEGGFREALRAFMQHRRELELLERKFAASPVREQLGVKPGETVEMVEREIINQGLYSGNWREIRDWLRSVPRKAGADPSKLSRVEQMAQFLDDGHGAQGEQKIKSYLRAFLTETNTPRSDAGHFVSKPLRDGRPELAEIMDKERERVFGRVQHINAVAAAERTEAIVRLADEANALYRAEKRRKGRLDFTDLIARAVRLLTSDASKWVLFKLDQGLDHILVDEAQDTSPEQWAIIRALSDDFFSGEGARPMAERTIFAVGDEKQSIFGFQGARPEEFEKARSHFARRIGALNANRTKDEQHPFEKVPLQISYRTVEAVLTAVDQVFSVEERFRGLSSDNQKTVHESNRKGKPGLVELWEAEVTEKTEEPDALAAVDEVMEEEASVRLARKVAKRIAFWRANDVRFADDGKPITPGDVLILVRNRGAIFHGVIKALKSAGVPVAGADRMKLGEQIAVQDLLTLGRFCLLPEDDLSLAALLKSPLIGFTDTELERAAIDRGKETLWAVLQTRSETDARFMRAVERLSGWRRAARALDPAAFYADVLSAGHGRRDLVARLGADAEEALNVFQSVLRQWQATHPPSLLAFVEAMDQNDTEVKRDMEEAHGRVRVMTVHGSKGLEARIVFLIDTAHDPKGGANKGPKLITIDDADPETAIWVKGQASDPKALTDARIRSTEGILAESRRLLYVALTRARDRLYIATARGAKAPPAEHWRGLIDAALVGHEGLITRDAEDGDGLVQQWGALGSRPAPPVQVEAVQASGFTPPDWLFREAGRDLPRPPPLRPSRIADAAEPPPLREGITVRAEARLRGDLIHHLLQHLPDVAEEHRSEKVARLAIARFPMLGADVREGAIQSALDLMGDHRFATLFSKTGRSEVDIAGVVSLNGWEVEVAGRMDRLVVEAARIVLIDYKTGRPPKDPQLVPQSHVKQLAIYEALLCKLYPDRAIVTAVVWTALPALVILPPERLEAARQAITRP
jgi:ATP-dependent helicase/nuclease subunit A